MINKLITQLNPCVEPHAVLQLLSRDQYQFVGDIGNDNITRIIGTGYLLLDVLINVVDPTFGNHFNRNNTNSIHVTAPIVIEQLNHMVLPVGDYPTSVFVPIITNYFERVYHFDSDFAINNIKQIVTDHTALNCTIELNKKE